MFWASRSATRRTKKCSGVTSCNAPGWAAAVDVRGGRVARNRCVVPENLVGRAHAVVLAGGSVFGLAAADGVAAMLATGNQITTRAESTPIPIVPAAVLYDLANGGARTGALIRVSRSGNARLTRGRGRLWFGIGGCRARREAGLRNGHRIRLRGCARADRRRTGGAQLRRFGAHARRQDILGLAIRAWRRIRRRRTASAIDASDPAPTTRGFLAISPMAAGNNTTLSVVLCTDLNTAECPAHRVFAGWHCAPSHTPVRRRYRFRAGKRRIAAQDQFHTRGANRTDRLGGRSCLARAIAGRCALEPHDSAGSRQAASPWASRQSVPACMRDAASRNRVRESFLHDASLLHHVNAIGDGSIHANR